MTVGKPSGHDSGAPATSHALPDHVQLGPEALKAYAHPLRMAILRYLRDHGRATSTTLAEALGESTGQTSYHLRQLAKHSLIEDDPGQSSGRERWWKARSAAVDLSTMLTDSATARAADILLADMLRERTELLSRWVGHLAHLSADDLVASRALHTASTMVLTAEELEELSTALSEVLDTFSERFRSRRNGEAPEGAVRIRAHIDVFPLLDEDGNTMR
ncbi:MAG: helix-turn-helix domain-containing protein [Actinomycetota bacterium]|nr:helix-turn-helix domain-containing protein [Actinomycetota bacterium]